MQKVRSTFIEHFSSLPPPAKHTYYPTSPLTPPSSDPTLLFTNAGMNQFKPIFLGQVEPGSGLEKLRSAVNSQKCIRAGGKHNDLEEVGYDTYHHTFFEMLGTWSFNSCYGKREAIEMAWEVLTKIYGIDEDRLYVTYFAGDAELGLDEDKETREIWESIVEDKSRIIGEGSKDNFWEMGEVGVCGPCTEIHFDRIGGRDASGYVNRDDPNVLEIWNLVFIEFNKKWDVEKDDAKVLEKLPEKHIDTGMGLERLTSVLQEKTSNYDIDAFDGIFERIREVSGARAYGGSETDKLDIAYRVLADHARALTFSIAEGLTPSNEGRGYVLRRILRRAVRYGKEVLGADLDGDFMSSICDSVVAEFGNDYKELREGQKRVREILSEEELAFNTLLARGIKFFEEEVTVKGEVSGSDAFFLYDTLGFPLDLTKLMASDRNLEVDVEGFENEMEKQKERSRRAGRKGKEGSVNIVGNFVLEAAQTSTLKNELGVEITDDTDKFVLGDVDTFGTVKAIYDGGSGIFVDNAAVDDENKAWGLILDKTSFYAEAGGQINDVGVINVIMDGQEGGGGSAVRFKVYDVQVYGGFVVHIGKFEGGAEGGVVNVGDSSIASVDLANRDDVRPNHTMTHVLNYALRRVLFGQDINQRGSLVTGEKLRFDFTCGKGLTLEEVQDVEDMVNGVIEENLRVFDDVVSLDEATAVNGVRAVFGESYPDPVRMISVGRPIEEMIANPSSEKNADVSVEFCGGTHLSNTGEAGRFVIMQEEGIAKGIRRITAVTKEAAIEAEKKGVQLTELVGEVESLVEKKDIEAEVLEISCNRLRKEVDGSMISQVRKTNLRGRVEKLAKSAVEMKKGAAGQKLNALLGELRTKLEGMEGENEIVVVEDLLGLDGKSAQKLVQKLGKIKPGLMFFGVSAAGGKVACVCSVGGGGGVGDGRIGADVWLKKTLDKFNGRGGGNAAFAQGQIVGEDVDLEEVMQAAKDSLVPSS